MHEIGLAGEILQLIEDTAARENFCQVASLRIEAGQLSGVETAALRFALQSIAPGTCIASADIVIEVPAGSASCNRCAADFEVESRYELCPRCGHHSLTITAGDRFQLLDIEVFDDQTTS